MRRVYDPAMPVVTISASYGSGGSEVAPALAERLGVRFVDRVVSPETAHRLAQAENAGLFWRLIRSISPAGGLTAGSIHAERELHDRFSDREALESALRDAAAAGDVVILGRAGALALRDHPGALHVRLDGPSEARVFRAMEVQSVDEATARERLAETDRARERFVRDIYGLDPTDPGLYALVLDGTAFTTAACVEVIVAAVAAPRRHIAPVA
jgi:cytidylate kinase